MLLYPRKPLTTYSGMPKTCHIILPMIGLEEHAREKKSATKSTNIVNIFGKDREKNSIFYLIHPEKSSADFSSFLHEIFPIYRKVLRRVPGTAPK